MNTFVHFVNNVEFKEGLKEKYVAVFRASLEGIFEDDRELMYYNTRELNSSEEEAFIESVISWYNDDCASVYSDLKDSELLAFHFNDDCNSALYSFWVRDKGLPDVNPRQINSAIDKAIDFWRNEMSGYIDEECPLVSDRAYKYILNQLKVLSRNQNFSIAI